MLVFGPKCCVLFPQESVLSDSSLRIEMVKECELAGVLGLL